MLVLWLATSYNMSCTINHSCCEIITGKVIPCPEDNILQYPWALTFFSNTSSMVFPEPYLGGAQWGVEPLASMLSDEG